MPAAWLSSRAGSVTRKVLIAASCAACGPLWANAVAEQNDVRVWKDETVVIYEGDISWGKWNLNHRLELSER
jgi:hypothetical protein